MPPLSTITDVALGLGAGVLTLRWLVLWLAALAHHRRWTPVVSGDTPAVLVVVPAFNEGRVIANTVGHLLQSDVPVRIRVVDDGSTDNTCEVVEALAQAHPRVELVRQPHNRGKAAALEAGWRGCAEPVVVTVDADTLVLSNTIGLLARSLEQRQVDAVASNVRVGHPHRALLRWQSLEYVTGLNIDRRAQALFGFVTTIPGACAAWRRTALEAVGGFSSDTLAEDTDLTLALLAAGRFVAFEPSASAFTEAPATLNDLFRQRRRWLYGNLQCLYKHRALLRSGAPLRARLLGWPNLAWAHFGVFVLGSCALVWSLLGGALDVRHLVALVAGSIGVLDVFTVLSAYGIDEGDKRDLLHWVPQRLLWPWLMLAVFWWVMFDLARRHAFTWDKLDRRGLLEPPQP